MLIDARVVQDVTRADPGTFARLLAIFGSLACRDLLRLLVLQLRLLLPHRRHQLTQLLLSATTRSF